MGTRARLDDNADGVAVFFFGTKKNEDTRQNLKILLCLLTLRNPGTIHR